MTTKSTATKATKRKRKREPRTPLKVNPLVAAVRHLVSAAELSAAIGVPRRTVYLMSRKKLIPFYRTGAHRYALRFNVDEVVQSLRVAPHSAPEQEATKGYEKG